jgi:hypothetical protein
VQRDPSTSPARSSVCSQALRDRYGVAGVVMQRKAFFSKPARPELIDDMAGKVQVAVAALGG